jgi:hypothetical protein
MAMREPLATPSCLLSFFFSLDRLQLIISAYRSSCSAHGSTCLSAIPGAGCDVHLRP